jgi:hypothetical protein
MPHFLRDQKITSITINEDGLVCLANNFINREKQINDSIPASEESAKRAIFTVVIRFDGKGYRLFSLNELLTHFRQAKDVERIFLTLETGESLASNRQLGAFLELRIDKSDSNNCFLTAASDDKDWVNSSFSLINDLVPRLKSRSYLARTAWTSLFIQVLGLAFGFTISLLGATRLSPMLAVENAYLFSFIFFLLLFSNTWTYLNQQILRAVDLLFPNVRFVKREKEKLHWFYQAIIGGIVGALVLYVLGQIGVLIMELLASAVKKNV